MSEVQEKIEDEEVEQDHEEEDNLNAKEIVKPKKRGTKVNIFSEAAMSNGYNISHNIQDFLWFRGFRYTSREEEERRESVFREFLSTLAPR